MDFQLYFSKWNPFSFLWRNIILILPLIFKLTDLSFCRVLKLIVHIFCQLIIAYCLVIWICLHSIIIFGTKNSLFFIRILCVYLLILNLTILEFVEILIGVFVLLILVNLLPKLVENCIWYLSIYLLIKLSLIYILVIHLPIIWRSNILTVRVLILGLHKQLIVLHWDLLLSTLINLPAMLILLIHIDCILS